MGEDHDRDRDPALAVHREVAEPSGRDGQRDRCPGEAREQAPDDDVGVAQPVDVDAERVGRGRTFANRAEVESRSGPVDPVPGDRHDGIANVDEDALVGEEDRPNHRKSREAGDRERRQEGDRAGLREVLAEHAGQARTEERQGKAGNDLLGLEADRDDGMEHREEPAGHRPEGQPEPRVARRDRRPEGDDRADQHHPFHAQVDDAGPLREDLADGREQQDRPGCDAGGEDGGQVHQAARRSMRTRYRSTTSLAMRQNRMIPWIIAGIPEGWISRPARIRAPKAMAAMITPYGWSLAM